MVTAIALVLHSMAAYALARLRFPGRDAIFLSMFATFLISQPVIIVPLFVLARASADKPLEGGALAVVVPTGSGAKP